MIRVPDGEVRFLSISSVVFGIGSVHRVKEKVDEFGARRALVVTVPSIATKTNLLERVKSALGNRYAGVFSGVRQHVPRKCVLEGARMARDIGADILISLGGSSTSDAAKGINLVLAEAEEIDNFFVKFDRPDIIKAAQFEKPKLCHIAVPTTLSAGEFNAIFGITDTERKCKDTFRDVKVVPKVIILDPEMTAYTPKELWASTGFKELSDAFGKACSHEPLPLTSALALRAIQVINRYLVPSVGEPLDLGARAMLQHAMWMEKYAIGPSGLGIVAALRHQIGAIFDVPHGVASTIVFPHCVNFNRPSINERLVPVAEALELPFKDADDAASATINRVGKLIGEIGLPTRLRDVGVRREGLQIIADAAMEDPGLKASLKPVTSKEQLIAILEQAW